MAASQIYDKGVQFELSSRASLVPQDEKLERTGWHFINWTDGTTTYADSARVTFYGEVTNLSANWEKNKYKLQFTKSSTEGEINVYNETGTVEYDPGVSVDYDTKLHVVATPNAGYELNTLTMNGIDIKSTGGYFNVPAADMNIVATWDDIQGVVYFHPGY